jgi:hypothetical protein
MENLLIMAIKRVAVCFSSVIALQMNIVQFKMLNLVIMIKPPLVIVKMIHCQNASTSNFTLILFVQTLIIPKRA